MSHGDGYFSCGEPTMKTLRLPNMWILVQILIWAIILILLIWPLASVLKASFIDETGAISASNYIDALTSRSYRRAIINTFIAGFGGMAGALALGLTLALIMNRFTIRGRALVQTLAVVALVSPPFIGAYAWIVLFGANGVIRNAFTSIGINLPTIYGAWGVIIVFAFKFFPHVFLLTSAALSGINRSLEDAAENLGMPPWKRLFRVTFPLILPTVTASGLLAFVLSIADFGTPRLIGRDFNVLATEAFTMFASELGGNPGMASTISILLIILSMALVGLQRYASRRSIHQTSVARSREPIKPRGIHAIILHGIVYAIVFIGSIPAITAVLFSFRKTNGPVFKPGLSIQSYEKVWFTVSTAIWNSIIFSLIAVAAIVIVGALLGYIITRKPSRSTAALDALLVIPYIVPGVVMGIAYIVRFNEPPLAITGTGLVIILAVFIRRLPYTARSVAAALKQLSPSLEEAAISLGMSPAKTFIKVTVPLIAPGIAAGALMSFVTAINELSSSLVLYTGGTITMPVKIYQSVIDGDYGTASALAAILLFVTVTIVYAAFRISGRKDIVMS
ncbi:MAG: ABC transporter permease [Beijerinckiaceae bacterium]